MNTLTLFRIMLLLSTAALAQAGAPPAARHASVEISGPGQVDARICRLDLPAHGCMKVPGWSSHMEQSLTLPSAGTYMLAWEDPGPFGANAGPAAYEVSIDGVRLGEPARGAGSQNHVITFSAGESCVLSFKVLQGGAGANIHDAPVTESVPEPGMYGMLLIGLGLLAFASHKRDTEKFD